MTNESPTTDQPAAGATDDARGLLAFGFLMGLAVTVPEDVLHILETLSTTRHELPSDERLEQVIGAQADTRTKALVAGIRESLDLARDRKLLSNLATQSFR